MYEERFYRNFARSKYSLEVSHKESDLLVSSDTALDENFVYGILKKYYGEIEAYIAKKPLFLTSLSPLPQDQQAPTIIKEMLECSQRTGIGPFAAVAGAVAQYVGGELLRYAREIIIENGGDIFIKINEDKLMGVYLGEKFFEPPSLNAPPGLLTLKIKKREDPFGVASSSAHIGHSLNFGRADLLMVVASSAIIADGFATSLSNRVKDAKTAQEVLKAAPKNPEILGLLVAVEGKIFLWGKLQIEAQN